MSYTVSEEQIEQDELNMHECMLPLMKLIDHMEHNKITPAVAEVYNIRNTPASVFALSMHHFCSMRKKLYLWHKDACMVTCRYTTYMNVYSSGLSSYLHMHAI